MTKVAEIVLDGYSAATSWSPIASHPDMVAVGSKVSSCGDEKKIKAHSLAVSLG
jgi:hypothetical protein